MFMLQNSSNERELEQQCTSHKDCKYTDQVSGHTNGHSRTTIVPSATWLGQTALLTTSFTSVQTIRCNGSGSGNFFRGEKTKGKTPGPVGSC